MLGRALIEADDWRGRAVLDRHVPAARRHIDPPRQDRLAVPALGAGPTRRPLDLLGQQGGEGRRHVLGQQNGLTHRRALQDPKQLEQRGWAAGRGADTQGPHQRPPRRRMG
ncbi:hypothetical protein D3C80_849710 [compost metagenome]